MKYFILSVIFITLSTACKKNKCDVIIPPTIPVTCDVRGNYAGTATASGSTTASPMAYKLQDNDFAVGSVTITGPATTFGGYRNTCDSVIISSWYNGNGNYYLLKGKLSNNQTVISGSFNNLTTTSDFGTFTLTKQ